MKAQSYLGFSNKRLTDKKGTTNMTVQHTPLPPEYEKIAKIIVNAAYAVHKNFGPGLLEAVYEPCFCHELDKRGAEYNLW